MYPRKGQSESERRAAEFMNAPPRATSNYPTIAFNDVLPVQPSVQYPAPAPTSFPVAPPPTAPPVHGSSPPAPPPIPGPRLNTTSNAPPAPPAATRPGTYGQMQQQPQRITSPTVPPRTTPPQHRPREDAMFQPPPPKVAPGQGTHANKKALIIGCNYANTEYELQGCIHDALNIEFMLTRHFGFRKENIRLLTDDGRRDAMPTRSNILTFINWLMRDLQPGDSLFFHFSGHGSQKPDYVGDERDGLNETLLPCDFKAAGQIVDDEVNRLLINPLPRDVYLHSVIDACHSGTAMDLEFYTKRKNGRIEWRSEGPTRVYKGTAGGIAVLFSACSDEEVAQDTDNLAGNVHTGAATHAFIEVIEHNGADLSYGQVLNHMYGTMDKLKGRTQQPTTIGGKILDKIATGVMSALGVPEQTPQISCNIQLNLNQSLRL